MRRAFVIAFAMSWLLILAGAAAAQDQPPATYPINERTEPLLSSIKRLNLFAQGEEVDILRFNPARKDTPVCRLDKEGRTTKLHKMPGAQLRVAYAIAAAIGEEDKLDAQAKKELAAALAAYKIHTFDEFGEITASRRPKGEAEALQQVNRDVDGAHHFRKLADAAKKTPSEQPRE
jgi:hypothetical protein